ncbi:MAG: tetratricopeptide repeat protein, partial [Bacteroidota bacterium]
MTRFLSCLLFFSLIGTSLLFSQIDQEAALADQYFLGGEFESSLELYQKLVKNDPSEKNLTRIVGSYEALGEFDEAIKFLDKSVRKHKDLVILPIMKAGLLEKTGNLKQAEKLYDEVIEKVMASEGNFIQIGSYLYQRGKLEYALATYLQGAKKLKREYAFSSEIANIYKQLGEYDKA